jgi:DNA modification methylase
MIRILVGDALDRLRTLPDGLARTCVTSPPYYGLRDYGMGGQIGLEASPEEYVARIVAVFGEVRRVLADDGTLWLNLGDSYAAERGGTHQPAETLAGGKNGRTAGGERVNRDRHDGFNPTRNAKGIGLKHKDLMGIPWMVAFALRSDGWYLRQEIIWHKPNPMPESVRDRCTKAHEHVFLLSKRPRYFYDADAIAEPATDPETIRGKSPRHSTHPEGGFDGHRTRKGLDAPQSGRETKNARSVWSITPRPFPDAHFATFPIELPDRCIRAGSAAGDTVLDPFAGAGTTLLAARNLDRDAVGIEINPEYAAMARRRVEDMTTETRIEE